MSRVLIISVVVLCGLLVLFFSWLPHPDIGSLPIFPKWLGKWVNHYGNLRTGVPFLFIATLLGFSTKTRFRNSIIILLASLVLVTIAELGQLFMAERHFDIWDIVWGMTGAVSGLLLGCIAKGLIRTAIP